MYEALGPHDNMNNGAANQQGHGERSRSNQRGQKKVYLMNLVSTQMRHYKRQT